MFDRRARQYDSIWRPARRLRLATSSCRWRRSRSGSSASTRSSCARRSSRRWARTTSRRPGRRACATAASCAATPCRTPCCRRSRSSRSTSATSSPARSRSRSCSTGRASGRSRSRRSTARDYPVLQGIFLLLSVSVVARQPGRRHRLRRARPAGADVTARRRARSGPRRRRGGRARRAALDFWASSLRRPDGLLGRRDPRRLRRPRDRSRRSSSGRSRRPSPPTGPRLEPPSAELTSSGPTSSAGDMLNLTVHGAADLDGHRPARDDHHGRRSGAVLGIVVGLRRRPDRRRPHADHRLLPRPADVRPRPHPHADHPRRRRHGATEVFGIRIDAARDRLRHRHHELVVDRADHPLADAVAEGARVRRPRPRHRREQRPHHAPAHPAERHQPHRRQRRADVRRRGPDRDDALVRRPRRPVPAVVGPAPRRGRGPSARRGSARGGTSCRRASASSSSCSRSRSSAAPSTTSSTRSGAADDDRARRRRPIPRRRGGGSAATLARQQRPLPKRPTRTRRCSSSRTSRRTSRSSRATVQAVDGVSFRLDHGEALGIAGESGCGKTTTALSLVRILPPTRRSSRAASS